MKIAIGLVLGVWLCFLPTYARAQPTVVDAPASAGGGGVLMPGASGAESQRTVTTTTTTQSGPAATPGLYFPLGSEAAKINADSLPSSSRPLSDVSASKDGFDLNRSSSSNTVRGSKGSFAVTGESVQQQAVVVPDVHTVRKGDTLWDLCGHYLGNSWDWPRIWSYNPDVRNPNWLYPGDQLRLRSAHDAGFSQVAQLGRNGHLRGSLGDGSGGVTGRFGSGSRVAEGTVFLRNEGYIDDPDKDTIGEVVGAREEQMLLGQGNHLYLDVKPKVDVKVGQTLTLFERSRKPEPVEGARQPPGEIVVIKGTLRVTDFDPKKHIARGEVIESADVIERGVKVGIMGRRYVVVAPRKSQVTVWARILNGIYPHVHIGQQQLLFIDRGKEDGLLPGNRLLVIRRGDSWRKSLDTTARSSRYRLRTDDPNPAQTEPIELKRDDREFPDEVIGELRIVHAHQWSSLAVVVSAARELLPGDRAVARQGY